MSLNDSGIIPPEVQQAWEAKSKIADELLKSTLKISSSSIEDIPVKSDKAKRRSTYNQLNAECFRPFYDAVIGDSSKNCLLYSSFPRLSKGTLYNKVADGLRWLCLNDIPVERRETYLKLKTHFKLSDEPLGVTFRFKGNTLGYSVGTLVTSLPDPASASDNTHKDIVSSPITGKVNMDDLISNDVKVKIDNSFKAQKEKITNFINDTSNEDKVDEVVFDKAMTDDEKIWVVNCFNGLNNMDFLFFGETKLKMMKVKI